MSRVIYRETHRLRAISIFLLVCLLITLSFSQAFCQTDEEEFKERLARFTGYIEEKSKIENPSKEDINKGEDYFNSLTQFANQYPTSKYADDAEFLSLFTHNAQEPDPESWERFAKKYPSGKLEDLTLQYLEKMNAVSFETYLPYDLMPLEARIMKSLFAKDYQAVIDYSAEFLKRVDFTDNRLKTARGASFIFARALISCKKLGERDEYERLLKQAVIVFPEQKEKLQEIWK